MSNKYRHPISSVINRFGQTVDSTINPDFEFKLGHVERVFSSAVDVSNYIGNLDLKPPDSSQLILLSSTRGLLPSIKKSILAQPLLRGINDSITRGDAVIYTNIEGKIFYLGPINVSNNPNYTPDHTFRKAIKASDDSRGYGKLFPKKIVSKLEKYQSPLDFPQEGLPGVERSVDRNSEPDLVSKFTDLVLEGRHSNSIRIGSKGIYPLITISNNRNGFVENRNDGSNISMFSDGSIKEHFPTGPFENSEDYLLSSDSKIINEMESETGYKGFKIGYGNDNIDKENEFDYNYGLSTVPEIKKDQMIIFSDKITFDAKENDITVSAFRNINFGAGKNFTLTNKGFTVLESKNIYIGKSAKQRTQPMVLGDKLGEFLAVITSILQDAHALVQGVPIPLVDAKGISLTTRINEVMKELSNEYKPQYDTEKGVPLSDRSIGGPRFYSRHHFIEPNPGEPGGRLKAKQQG
tara:strand:+ start:145 stop:1539 length:1395 start_codon:yes stop_codon:yes gene_type:complete